MQKKGIFYIFVILAIATLFRLWYLDSIPSGLYPDEAINGNEAITNPGHVFYRENNGREGLFINLMSLSFSIFGVSIWSLKFVSAVIGVLTVLGLYLLIEEFSIQCNEVFPRYISLMASFFLAISFWHTNFSRIAFRGILLPFILVFAFYFLFRGFRTKKNISLIAGGILFGLGFYTYISYRFVVLLFLIVLGMFWCIYRIEGLKKQFLFSIFYFLFSIFIIALPIGIYFFQHPGDFVGRATPISIFAAKNTIGEFSKSLVLHLGMFNLYGDPNWRHNFSSSPQLFWPIGILFLIGFFLSIKNLFLAKKEKNYFLFSVLCFLISWLFIFLLPGILTYEGIPHSLRTIGVIPAVYIFAALGGSYLYNWLNSKIQNKRKLFIICFFFLITLLSCQFYKYFFCWAKKPEVANAFSRNYLKIGDYLNSLPSNIKKYVLVNREGVPVPLPDGLPLPAQSVMFIERIKYGSLQSNYLKPDQLSKIDTKDQPTLIIPMAYQEELFERLKQQFPQGRIKQQNNFVVYTINF